MKRNIPLKGLVDNLGTQKKWRKVDAIIIGEKGEGNCDTVLTGT